MSDESFPRLDALPGAQRRLWDELGDTPRDFVLFGGTALALRLGHRQSVDFDFFSPNGFDPMRLYGSIAYLEGGEVVQNEKNTLTCIVDRQGPVKVSFFGGIDLPRIDPVDASVVPIGGLRDIAGMKMAVVQQRAESKDYLDIHAILNTGVLTLSQALSCACALYGKAFNPLISLKALSCFEDGDLPELSAEVRRAIQDAVKSVDLDHPAPCVAEGGHG